MIITDLAEVKRFILDILKNKLSEKQTGMKQLRTLKNESHWSLDFDIGNGEIH